MTIQHWSPPDIRRDILAAALRWDAADPVAVHVRPEVRARMGPGPLSRPPRTGTGQGDDIPVVVDDQLPRAPGYEVHRVAPPAPGPLRRELPLEEDGPRTAAPGPTPAAPCGVRSWTGENRRGPRSRTRRWLRVHHPRHGPA
jgi:hypothetical protein